MATLDPSRTAVEVDECELTVAKALLDAPHEVRPRTREAREVLAELERAGISEDGAIEGYPARLLSVVLQPELRLILERFAGEKPLNDFAAVAQGFGVWGEQKPDGATEFTPIEPELIPWQVARVVGLGPRTRSRLSETLEFRAKALDAAVKQLADGDVRAAAHSLADDPGLQEGRSDVIMELLMLRRLSWRAVSLWTDKSGERKATGVAVIDGGDAGYWVSTHIGKETKNAIVRLEPVESGEIWDRIVELVPHPIGANDG